VIRELVLGMTQRDTTPGDTIIRSGDPGYHMYIIMAGAVDVFPPGNRVGTRRRWARMREVGVCVCVQVSVCAGLRVSVCLCASICVRMCRCVCACLSVSMPLSLCVLGLCACECEFVSL
jgi:hypothetical protein